MSKITKFAIRTDRRFMFVDASYDAAVKRAVKLGFLKNPEIEPERIELGFCTKFDEFIPRQLVNTNKLDLAISLPCT
jgi:hypothetical protein